MNRWKNRSLLCSLAALSTTLLFTGCIADDSVPNRRGMERPALIGGDAKARENAEKRELEAPKRQAPAGVGAEFPGQSLLPTSSPSIVMLADLPATAPTTLPAPAPAPAHPVINDLKPMALPGRTMRVPGTTQEIPPYWGEQTVLKDYPRRPYPTTQVTYASGQILHNPVYYGDLFKRDYPSTYACPVESVGQDYAEIPWFYGETIALPVLMVIHPPLAQAQTRWTDDSPVYHGQLPATGRIDPVPLPGEIRWVYTFTSSTQPLPPAPSTQQGVFMVPDSATTRP